MIVRVLTAVDVIVRVVVMSWLELDMVVDAELVIKDSLDVVDCRGSKDVVVVVLKTGTGIFGVGNGTYDAEEGDGVGDGVPPEISPCSKASISSRRCSISLTKLRRSPGRSERPLWMFWISARAALPDAIEGVGGSEGIVVVTSITGTTSCRGW